MTGDELKAVASEMLLQLAMEQSGVDEKDVVLTHVSVIGANTTLYLGQ